LDFSSTALPPNSAGNTFQIKTYYSLPKVFVSELYENFKAKDFRFTDEDMFKLGMDLIKALKILKENHIVHGDLRLDYIAQNEKKDFELIDKF